MPKNKDNFFETNIIISKISRKRNSKLPKSYEIMHLIVDMIVIRCKCAFQIRFNVPNNFQLKSSKILIKFEKYHII